jgi:hypothetical protein
MLKGPAGNGKSVSVKRLAWEAGVTYEQLALHVNGPAGLRIETSCRDSSPDGEAYFFIR